MPDYQSTRQKSQEPPQEPIQRPADGLIKTLSPSTPLPILVSSTPDVKPGWQSSEFWLTALIIVGVFVSLILGRITVNDITNLWPIIAGGVGYAVSRGLAKKG